MAASSTSECSELQQELHAAWRFLESGHEQLERHLTGLAHTGVVIKDSKAQVRELRGLIEQVERGTQCCWRAASRHGQKV
jgi:hypothetical protein